MRTHEREILIYYNPRASAHKKVIALAKGMGVPVRTFTFAQAPSTSTSSELIKAPIALRGYKAVLCEQATDVYKLQQEDSVLSDR